MLPWRPSTSGTGRGGVWQTQSVSELKDFVKKLTTLPEITVTPSHSPSLSPSPFTPRVRVLAGRLYSFHLCLPSLHFFAVRVQGLGFRV